MSDERVGSTYVGAHEGKAIDECKTVALGSQCMDEAEVCSHKVREFFAIGLRVETEEEENRVRGQILLVDKVVQACELKRDFRCSLQVADEDGPHKEVSVPATITKAVAWDA